MKKENMAMLCDFYEFTMSNGFFKNGFYKRSVYFDVFFRKVPDNGGFAIAAGLEQVIDYIRKLHFDDEDIEWNARVPRRADNDRQGARYRSAAYRDLCAADPQPPDAYRHQG